MRLSRRELLKGMGLVAGGLGLSAAGYDHLIPFIHQPEDVIPGASTWYATTCRACPAGCGMLARSREARIVKCEGNPLQPISYARLCARGQAQLDALYHPDRIKGPKQRRGGDLASVSWDDGLKGAADAIKGAKGRIALMTDLQTGSLDAAMTAVGTGLGITRMLRYEPVDYSPLKAATGGVVPWFNIAGSDFLISFAADFLETWISPVEFAVMFGAIRQVRNDRRARFVYVGPRVSATAASADLRIIVPPGTEAAVAYAIAAEAGVGGASGGYTADSVARSLGINSDDIRSAARAYAAAAKPLALPGGDADTARAAMSLNAGKAGGLVDKGRRHALSLTSTAADMFALVSDMNAGAVDVLIVHQANPVYSLPDPKPFLDGLKKVKTVISLSTYLDETTTHAQWVLPSSHPIESWGDYVPYPDVMSILQPAMESIFETRQAGDILFELVSRTGAGAAGVFGGAGTWYEFLRRRWGAPTAAGASPDDVAPGWEAFVQRGGKWSATSTAGIVPPMVGIETELPAASGPSAPVTAASGGTSAGTAPAPASAAGGTALGTGTAGLGPVPSPAAPPTTPPPAPTMPGPNEIRLWVYPHIYFYDGRTANIRTLQEVAEPMTKAVWGSWAEMNPETARLIGVSDKLGWHKDVVTVTRGGASVDLPVFVWEGVAKGTVAMPLGQGHTAYGRWSSENGSNAYPLTAATNAGVKVSPSGVSQTLSVIRGSDRQHGRKLALVTYLGKPTNREEIVMPTPEGYKHEDFYPGHKHTMHRWAMVVDLDKCIGCNACVAACYMENNVAVVGSRDASWGREMGWLRIDRYVDWERKAAPVLFEPMLCQHCDNAPCEPVCPVFAASHSEDGVNMQVYNRCIGTRYCSNNCPYKVRRFNWFRFPWPEPLNWRLNPDVTVRDRGVMEKCTFCIQRIRGGQTLARKEGREPRDGEIVTACQQTCPTGVYTFGDLMDPNSRVSEIIKNDPRAFQALPKLNTKPAVIYLKRIAEVI